MSEICNNRNTKLCLDLLIADSEEQVISILKTAGYWDAPGSWRLLGDRESNYSVIGNQQSRPEAALTEKIINSIDARLMKKCLVAGIEPTGADAPRSIREAVSLFFEETFKPDDLGGSIASWDRKKRREISEEITVALTGSRKRPCITISDLGEGQSPDMMPETFLSIDRQNKLRIPFVQGKFNMGGTGVLEFCGDNNLQLIVTKRHPCIGQLNRTQDPSSDLWGFTIVRIQSPPEKVKNSIYTYLAPIGATEQPHRGGVLRFNADELLLFPKDNKPYARSAKWGSAVKLYDYDMKGFSSHACLPDGLLFRLGTMLPEPALPVCVYECRDFRGKEKGSFSNPLTGLITRLEDNRASNIEDGFPDAVPFHVHSEKMVARIYAFKKGKAETYRTSEGILFSINGQTHGAIPKTFFNREKLKLGYIKNSVLIIIDCSDISNRARERLFMNSRDRLRDNEFKKAVEEILQDIISSHPGLRLLKDQRRNEEISERIDDSKPLEEVLRKLFKSSPSLNSLFLTGNRLSNPSKSKSGSDAGGGGGSESGESQFKGRLHPTYFKFKKVNYGEILHRECEIGRKTRIEFETDAVNDYFKRNANSGEFVIEVLEGDIDGQNIDGFCNPHNGVATATLYIPDNLTVGDSLTIQLTVKDNVIQDPFVNIVKLRLKPKTETVSGKKHKRDNTNAGSGDETISSGISFPAYKEVEEHEWQDYGFDKYSACKIVQAEKEGHTIYDFFINVDNLFLKTEMKYNSEHPLLYKSKFVYGNILFGLALIKDYRDQQDKRTKNIATDTSKQSIEDFVFQTSRAISPFILPIINNLGALKEEDIQIAV